MALGFGGVVFDRARAASAVLLIGLVAALTYGQNQTITSGEVPPTFSNPAFTSNAVAPLKKGDALPANFVIGHGCMEAWDPRVHVFVNGDQTVKYPVSGVVNCSDSDSGSFAVFASTTVIRTDMRADQASRANGYLIESKRAIKAGEAVPTLIFMGNGVYSIVSIESAHGQTDKGNTAIAEPWLTIFDTRLKPSDQLLVVQAWRASNETVTGLLSVPGLMKPQ
jgi:hypothetical protein